MKAIITKKGRFVCFVSPLKYGFFEIQAEGNYHIHANQIKAMGLSIVEPNFLAKRLFLSLRKFLPW